MTLQARSCPTCQSIGAPRVVHEDQLCADSWHNVLMSTPQLPDHGTTPWLDRYTSLCGEILSEYVTYPQLIEIAAEMERRAMPVVLDAMEDAVSEAANAHRAMSNAANEQLRIQLLAALGAADDGKTSLATYIAQLTAERDEARSNLHPEVALRAFAEYDARRLKRHRDGLLAERDAMLPVVEAVDRYVVADAVLEEADSDGAEWKAAEQERDHAWDALLDAHNAYVKYAHYAGMATPTTLGATETPERRRCHHCQADATVTTVEAGT